MLRASALPGAKIRMTKVGPSVLACTATNDLGEQNDFVKNLSSGLIRLRKTDKERRQQLYGPDVPDEDHSSGEEDEYHEPVTRSAKRRKVARAD